MTWELEKELRNFLRNGVGKSPEELQAGRAYAYEVPCIYAAPCVYAVPSVGEIYNIPLYGA